MRRWLLVPVVLVAAVIAAFALSPWPGVILIRIAFDRGAAAAAEGLRPFVPDGVTTITRAYDSGDPGAVLDIHRRPGTAADAPVIVWVHGGGFVSGRRQDLTNYLTILAGQGFTTVNVDYTIAPDAHYPTPVRQLGTALAYLHQNRAALGLGTGGFVLGGDSAGAQIAAQTAALATGPDYARLVAMPAAPWASDLRGVILFCGVYDMAALGQGGGLLGWFVHAAGWAYSGTRDWRTDPGFATATVTPHVTAAFPPAFISAGNADPLAPQSVALAARLGALGVAVDTLFFPPGYAPALGHEYQFDLTAEAGRQALDRLTEWLRAL